MIRLLHSLRRSRGLEHRARPKSETPECGVQHPIGVARYEICDFLFRYGFDSDSPVHHLLAMEQAIYLAVSATISQSTRTRLFPPKRQWRIFE